MLIKIKKRFLVNVIDALMSEPGGSANYRMQGVPRDAIFQEYVRTYFGRKRNSYSMQIDWNRFDNNLIYCVEDGYLRINQMKNFEITSKGNDYIQWWYYPSKFFEHWLVRAIVVAVISFISGLLLGRYIKYL